MHELPTQNCGSGGSCKRTFWGSFHGFMLLLGTVNTSLKYNLLGAEGWTGLCTSLLTRGTNALSNLISACLVCSLSLCLIDFWIVVVRVEDVHCVGWRPHGWVL